MKVVYLLWVTVLIGDRTLRILDDVWSSLAVAKERQEQILSAGYYAGNKVKACSVVKLHVRRHII